MIVLSTIILDARITLPPTLHTTHRLIRIVLPVQRCNDVAADNSRRYAFPCNNLFPIVFPNFDILDQGHGGLEDGAIDRPVFTVYIYTPIPFRVPIRHGSMTKNADVFSGPSGDRERYVSTNRLVAVGEL